MEIWSQVSFETCCLNNKTAAETTQVSAAAFSNPDIAPIDEGKFYLPVPLHRHYIDTIQR